MWLSEGDFSIPLPAGVAGVAIAAIFAVAFVLGIYLKRRSAPIEPGSAENAIDAGVAAATSALAAQLALRDAKIIQLERELDQAYQDGFKPRPRPEGVIRD